MTTGTGTWLPAVVLTSALLMVSCAVGTEGRPEEARPRPDGGGPVAGGSSDPGLARPPGEQALVTRVVDGDTFEAKVDGEILDIRLIGIDTPESVKPNEPVECFGPEASDFTEQRLNRSTVLLEWDVERIDPFGRTLAYVWIGRRLFNEDIVRQGFATVATFPPNVAHVERLVEAERKARRDGLGLWRSCLSVINTGADWRELGDVA